MNKISKKQIKNIAIEDFGKDHWSLLAYCEYRVINHSNELDITHLRCKNLAIATTPLGQNMWKPEYGTRLNGYFLENDKVDETKRFLDHDDFDCLDDLEVAGLLRNVGTMIAPYAELTDKGFKIMSLLNKHKQEGGYFSNFQDVLSKNNK